MHNETDGTKLFHKLATRGYTVIPIKPCAKMPARWTGTHWLPLKAWRTLDNDPALLDVWATWPFPGVGSPTGAQIVFDLDTMHTPLRKAILLKIHELSL